MANLLVAGNSSNGGTAITTDTSGTLNIVTGSGSGSNAITIDASQAVTMPGTLAVTGAQTIGGNLTVTGTITGTGGVSGGLGTGQTWQSFTVGSTRISGTTYTNTTSKPIAVAIVAQVSVALSMTIDGVSLTGNATNSGTNRSWTLYIVPPNQTYVTSGTLTNWYELR